ncbi:MAG: chitobiase/beta-hexosaminidase C-terminal domain-containing protein [Clostridia bacterium]|nr:chitobiase/beta-hexosaminidase C-terminal domain-containing protein [Clostridia bacterium]
MNQLFSRIKNKWALFGISAGATLVLLLLIFLLFLRGPFSALFAKQGANAYQEGNYEKAVNRYSLALHLKKNKEEIYSGYADAMVGLKDYSRAQEILDQGIDRLGGAESLYLAKARTFTAQGKIGEAADFLDQIENSYINKKLQSERPANISFSPSQGRYSTAQKITLQQREGETIYYTLNGEDPTTASSVYTTPITVSSTSTLTALSVSTSGLVSPRLQLTYEIDNANESIEFTDPKIEKMVRAALEQPSGELYAARLASVTHLSNEGIEGEIRSLKDLEYLPSLDTLFIDGEYLIEDYAPLTTLPALSALTLTDCGLSDTDLTSLSACNQLMQLDISRNHVTSLDPIRSLIYLEYLNAADNDIISASALTEFPLLNYLDLSDNGLSDLEAVSGLTELTVLHIPRNRISDLTPLTDLPKLTQLSLAGNTPSNIKKLASVSTLIFAAFSNCVISIVASTNATYVLIPLFAEISSLYLNSYSFEPSLYINLPILSIPTVATATAFFVDGIKSILSPVYKHIAL